MRVPPHLCARLQLCAIRALLFNPSGSRGRPLDGVYPRVHFSVTAFERRLRHSVHSILHFFRLLHFPTGNLQAGGLDPRAGASRSKARTCGPGGREPDRLEKTEAARREAEKVREAKEFARAEELDRRMREHVRRQISEQSAPRDSNNLE